MIKSKALTVPTSLAVDMDAGAPTGITVAHSAEYDLGSTAFSLPFDITADDWTPSAEQWIFLKKQDANNYWGLKLNTNSTLTFIAVVASSTILSVTSTAALSAVVGQSVFGAVAVTRESASVAGSAVFIANGAALGTSVAITAGTPASISNTGILYLAGTDTAGSAMIVRAFYPYNRALSVAEVTTLRTSGVAAADAAGIQTKYMSDFSSSVDGFAVSGGTQTANVDGIGGLDNWLRFYCSGSNSSHYTTRPMFIVGRSYDIKFTHYLPVNTNVDGVRVAPDGSARIYTTIGAATTVTFSFTASTENLTISATKAGAQTFVGAGSAVDDLFYVRAIEVRQLGNTLSLPSTGLDASGTAWTDASGNGNSATLPASGATKISASK